MQVSEVMKNTTWYVKLQLDGWSPDWLCSGCGAGPTWLLEAVLPLHHLQRAPLPQCGGGVLLEVSWEAPERGGRTNHDQGSCAGRSSDHGQLKGYSDLSQKSWCDFSKFLQETSNQLPELMELESRLLGKIQKNRDELRSVTQKLDHIHTLLMAMASPQAQQTAASALERMRSPRSDAPSESEAEWGNELQIQSSMYCPIMCACSVVCCSFIKIIIGLSPQLSCSLK